MDDAPKLARQQAGRQAAAAAAADEERPGESATVNDGWWSRGRDWEDQPYRPIQLQ
jgi:hypothetical protein